jgi:demethoxyubiquinone hydroxylase (CLK1/Coq7/Cat5 family)
MTQPSFSLAVLFPGTQTENTLHLKWNEKKERKRVTKTSPSPPLPQRQAFALGAYSLS